jgi:capsular polysaccharide biosynthesis protein
MGLQKLFLNTPDHFIKTRDWTAVNKDNSGVRFISLSDEVKIEEKPPIVIGHPISQRFKRHYHRTIPGPFVAIIPGGQVFGEYTNMIITPDNFILADVSREFGAEGGKKASEFSIFHNRMKMPAKKRNILGNTAVISTCGSNNFHHWNYDVLPRLHLLKKAAIFDSIDHFIINYKGLGFQLEGLSRLGIDKKKIVNSDGDPFFFAEAEYLYIPSLPEDLGTISPWVLNFLRETFLNGNAERSSRYEKMFISRKNVQSRDIINGQEVKQELFDRGYTEFIPENYSMQDAAGYFAKARSIVSVHGSGLSNLSFIGENTGVLDIMAPYHQDPYYWMIANQRNARYVALFAEGPHPNDDVDLVKKKVDSDLLIDIAKLKEALELLS